LVYVRTLAGFTQRIAERKAKSKVKVTHCTLSLYKSVIVLDMSCNKRNNSLHSHW